MQSAAGHFTARSGAGSQSITGLGFQPKCLLLWATGSVGRAGASTRDAGIQLSLGVAAAFGGTTRQQCVRWSAIDAVTTAREIESISSTQVLNALTVASNGASTAIATAALASFDSDGFTLTFAVATKALEVAYLAIGGADITAQVSTFLTGTGAGARTHSAVFGFDPDVLITFALPPVASSGGLGIGVGTRQNLDQWGMGVTAKSGVTTTDTQRAFSPTNLLHLPDTSSGAFAIDGQWTGGSGGNVTMTYLAAVGSATVVALGISGLNAQAGYLDKPTAGTTPVNQDIATGWTPSLALLGSIFNVGSNWATHGRIGLGIGDGTHRSIAYVTDDDALTTTNAENAFRTDRVMVQADGGAPTAEATDAIVSNGYRLAWQTIDASGERIGYLIIGPRPIALDASGDLAFGGPDPLIAPSAQLFATGAMIFDGQAIIGRGQALGQDAAGSVVFGGPDPRLMLDFTDVLHAAGDLALDGNVHLRLDWGGKLTAAGDLALDGATHLSLTHELKQNAIGSLLFSQGAQRISTQPRFKQADIGGLKIDGFAFIIAALPEPATAGPGDLPGTINLVRNPSVEKDLTDWTGFGGAVVTRVPSRAWHGGFSAQVVLPTTANAGLRIGSLPGLGAAGVTEPGLAQVRLSGAGVTGLDAHLEARYTDGTTVVGTTLLGPALPGDDSWIELRLPETPPDPTKTLIDYTIVVQRSTSGAAMTFWADGAQIEIDQGQGISTFAYGGDGLPYYRWSDIPDLSFSIRDPIPRQDRGIGQGGVVTMQPRLYRANFMGELLEDISDGVLSATATADPGRDVAWTLDATMTLDGFRRLTPFVDWLVPTLTVTYPDGSQRSGPLGLYFVLGGNQTRNEFGGTVKVDARDPLWLLSEQGYSAPYSVGAGANVIATVKSILAGAVLTGDATDARRRYQIDDATIVTSEAKEWQLTDSRLKIINDLLEDAGFFPLYTTKTGIITTRATGSGMYLNREPARLWYANAPLGTVLPTRPLPLQASLPSEVVGAINTSPNTGDTQNQLLLINDSPKASPSGTSTSYLITDPRNSRNWFVQVSTALNIPIELLERLFTRTIYRRFETSGGLDWQQVAAALAEHLSTKNETLSLAVLPDPAVELTREVVYLALWDGTGDPIAVGKYLVNSVKYGFTPGSALMQLDLGRVVEASATLVAGG
jgi:hypothetical protein